MKALGLTVRRGFVMGIAAGLVACGASSNNPQSSIEDRAGSSASALSGSSGPASGSTFGRGNTGVFRDPCAIRFTDGVALAAGDREHVLRVIDPDDAMARLRDRYGSPRGPGRQFKDVLPLFFRQMPEVKRHVALEPADSLGFEIVILRDRAITLHIK